MPANVTTERRREQYRRAAEVQRRKKGIAPVKGVPISCAECGVIFPRYSHMTHSCPPCQRNRVLERARAASAAKQATPEGRKAANEWSKAKRAACKKTRVSSHMKVMMHRAIGKRKAGRSWREFVDYTVAELIDHLERQFTAGMTWENQGDWHIDHIVPQSSFDFTDPRDDEFRRCWGLPNLRPLWRTANLRKQATRTHLI